MFNQALFFLTGFVVLLYGAHKVVRAGGNLALMYGMSSFFVGVTVISIGTSIPEIATSVFSAWYGAGDIVVGNIVGSETAQITLAVGIVALISPIIAERKNVMVYGGGMVLAMIIMMLALESGTITHFEGGLMILSYVFFIYYLYTNEGGEEISDDIEEMEGHEAIAWMMAGTVMVVVGGHLMVSNGITLARVAGIPEYLIGLLTGLGTTLPEIAIAGLAAYRGDTGISAGSLLGSNITDPVFSLGLGALVAEITVTNPGSVMQSAGYMLAASIMVITTLLVHENIDRQTGFFCILLYLPSFLIL